MTKSSRTPPPPAAPDDGEHIWRAIFDAITDPIFLHDRDLRIVRANSAYAARAGMTMEELLGKPYWEAFPKSGGPLPSCSRGMKRAEEEEEEEEVRLPTGEIFRSRSFARFEAGKHVYSIHLLEDVTEARRLREQTEEQAALLDLAPALVRDLAGRISYWSAGAEALYGYRREEALGQVAHELLRTRFPVPFEQIEAATLATGRWRGELGHTRRDGAEIAVASEWALQRGQDGRPRGFLEVNNDITARKAAEAKLRLLLESLPQRIFYKDTHSVYVAANGNYARDLGLENGDAIAGRDDYEFYPRELADKYRADDRRVMEQGEVEDIEEPYLQDGAEFWVHTVKVPVRDAGGKVAGVLCIFWDITERKRDRNRIERLNRLYRTLSRCNTTLVRTADELALARDMSRILVEQGGYRLAWVSYLTEDGQPLPLAWAGEGAGEDFGAWLRELYASGAIELCPAAEALRGGAPVTFALPDAPPLARLKALGAEHAATFPLAVEGATIGALCLCAGDPAAFAGESRALLEELAGDLAFGIATLRGRAAREKLEAEQLRNLETLEHNLDATVAAIAATVEMRDPYTAGHQKRVALLAAAIAAEMGLPHERTEGIRIAGVVHDIGKIHVPAEILANPAKLSDAEFEIIKTHPQAGWEILRGIEFAWPVSEIVWQYHEKLDGSGYPRGLKGDDILLDARILCVADVVEAMASHRPYRPGFGIFPALQEISRNKGKTYDQQAVEACLRLFLERGYAL